MKALESLPRRYRPQTWSELVEQGPIRKILEDQLNSGTVRSVNLFTGPAGCGKAQPLYSGILTPNGYIEMGDVAVGQEVFTHKGNIGKVIGIYPQGERPIYEIRLEDNSRIRVSDEHLNIVLINNKEEVIVTKELISMFNSGDYGLYIPNVCFSENDIKKLKGIFDFHKRFMIHSPRRIVDISYVRNEECQCIMIDHEDHTYISDDFIPTHNTTTARLLAKSIEPCKTNIIEIDAASYTGVDNVRTIIDNCKTKPLNGKNKIFIIDEVHMLSQSAFNSLLKILEEPPSYCIFILCTTDPQKILPTILSRVVRYDFQKISYNSIIDRLNYVLEKEKENPDGCGIQSWDPQVLNFIANASQGGMRDALTLLDKCVSYSKNLTVDDVLTVLNITSYDVQFNLLDSIITKNEKLLIDTIDGLYKKGKDLKLFVKTFLNFVLEVQKYILLKRTGCMNIHDYVDIPNYYDNKLITYNDTNILKGLLFTLVTLNNQLKWETNIKTVLESTLLLEIL